MKTIAVFLPNWVGDVVMATPTLRALREHFPSARIVGVMRPHAADALAGTAWLDQHLLYDPRSADSRLRGWAVCRRLRREQIDLALLLPNSWRTALLARFGGARDRLGYVRGGRGILLNRKLYPPRSGKQLAAVSALDYYLELAYAAGCPSASRQVELATLPVDERSSNSKE